VAKNTDLAGESNDGRIETFTDISYLRYPVEVENQYYMLRTAAHAFSDPGGRSKKPELNLLIILKAIPHTRLG
jgi:hypothetical protein